MSKILFSFSELYDLCSGSWLSSVQPATPAVITGVFDDSRALIPGSLFIAIEGELADGHNFIRQALAKGAAGLIVEKAPDAALLAELRDKSLPCLQVKDSLVAFQQLAGAWRQKFPELQVLAITGSSGKTSCKELCAAILEHNFPGKVLKTEGNTNNHYGVPRNLLRISENTAYAVLELGSNHHGEISELARLVDPQYSLISNIGPAHLEYFGDLQGVATEKASLFAETAKEGTAIYPQQSTGLTTMQNAAKGKKQLSFGDCPEADIRAEYLGLCKDKFRIRLSWKDSAESYEFDWKLPGKHQALNAAATAAFGSAIKLDKEQIIAALQNCSPSQGRMQLFEKDGIIWCNDAYNANPASTKAALLSFAEICQNTEKVVLILGDMRELGKHSAAEHLKVLQLAKEKFPDARIVTVGKEIANAAKELQLENFPDADTIKADVLPSIKVGAKVLLKASNGVGLHRLVISG